MFNQNAIINLIIFALYMGIMIGIGAFFYKKSESHSDYILGGRGMNPWVTAMSAQERLAFDGASGVGICFVAGSV